MKDLLRFVWRGALGGAIIPSLFWAYYLWVFFGTPLFWLVLITSYGLAIPGTIVGVGLWVCALFFDRVGALWRVLIGMAIASTILVLVCLASIDSFTYDSQYFRRLIFSAVFYVAVGGMAGWICPATRIFRKEPELPYWERVREYEAAQAEHEFWKAQRESGKSREVRLRT